ncbi:MAG: uroporphyrinogen-III synthase [Proteobacteria bacterium]|nr:uroporphyrinogen-III synthase [Pseudomonadota bacterium]
MRVLILRPEREATALATALRERGHTPVIAPLFHLEFLHPAGDFAASLSACQAVLLTSANGARALAEASPQRARPILAVGDTTATTAEGLGFTDVTSANGNVEALAELVRRRLDPAKGPLLHASGRDIAGDLAALLAPAGFTVNRVVLYEAREESTLPEPARAALAARAVDVVPLFSPRAASTFAGMVKAAGLVDTLGGVTAVGISLAALAPVAGLPFRDTVAASRPTRQAVLDEIDRLATAGPPDKATDKATGDVSMSDAPAGPATDAAPPPPTPAAPPPRPAKAGIGVTGAFVAGLVASALVVAGTVASLPYWPPRYQAMMRGTAGAPTASPGVDLAAIQAAAVAAAKDGIDQARRDLAARIDDLDKKVRALSTAAAAADPAAQQRAEAEAQRLRAQVEAQVRELAEREVRQRAEQIAAGAATAPAPALAPSPAQAAATADTEKEIATLRREIAALQSAMGALDTAMSAQREENVRQREQAKALADAVSVRSAGEQRALAAARASALVGVAARLNTALDTGAPFARELDLLVPLIQGDAQIAAIAKALQEPAVRGVPAPAALEAEFPAMAKAALADDLADDSYGARLLGKVKGLVSLRRVGDVPGDTTEAKLARAETALQRGDLAGAVALVKSLPEPTHKATAAWLARADARLAAKAEVDQLAAQAVALLGAAR